MKSKRFVDPRRLVNLSDLGYTGGGTGASYGAAAGAGAGLIAGATYGSVVPIVGTGIGGAVGAAVGAATSLVKGLEGGSSHAQRMAKAAAIAAQLAAQAQKGADSVAWRVQAGIFELTPFDGNWAFDPNGDWNVIYWVGTGEKESGMWNFTPPAPDGYKVAQQVSGGNQATTTTQWHMARWRGDGPSPIYTLMRKRQSDSAASFNAQAAASAQQDHDAQVAAQQAAYAQASLEAAITQADIQRKSKDYDGALMTLNQALLKAPSVPDGVSRVQAMLASVSAEQQKVTTAAAAKQDAQQALEDAISSAQQTARRGNFDDADSILAGASQYVNVIGSFSAKSQLRNAQMSIDDMRQRADDANKAKAAADASALAQQQQQLANQQAAAQIQATLQAAAQTPSQAPVAIAPAPGPSPMMLQFQQMMQQMQMQSMAPMGPSGPAPSMAPSASPSDSGSDGSGGFSITDAAAASDDTSMMGLGEIRSSGPSQIPWGKIAIGGIAAVILWKMLRKRS